MYDARHDVDQIYWPTKHEPGDGIHAVDWKICSRVNCPVNAKHVLL